jgi:predicted O-linked N-acetylglucosamine transferase (SPINDLY family)
VLAGSVMQAISACQKALEINPGSEVALTWLGACFAKQGEIATAIEHFDRALAIRPDYEDAITKKIFAFDFLPDADLAELQKARRSWWDAIGAKLEQRVLQPRSLDPQRRMVVGYVSSDFRNHSAALAFGPILRCHDHAAVHVICYSCSPIRDEVTVGFQALVDSWVDAWRLSDDELADRIVADKVDILVDLSGHTAGNRLTVFARKPAPIQISAWGAATGTGLRTMDYLFSDPVLIPEAARSLFAERFYDLPCAMTMEPILDVRPFALPMIANGYITFGVFNRIDKISDVALDVWSALMRAVCGSHLVIKNSALDDQFLRDGLVARFVAHGIEEDRIRCIGSTSRPEHLLAFQYVDISLDTFPQNGGISTWESLYMGVPVIAKLGNGPSARIAGAVLKAIGLNDFVADDDQGYIEIAERFASQATVLQVLRTELPARLSNSAVGNVKTYTRRVEEAYRALWSTYCKSAGG